MIDGVNHVTLAVRDLDRSFPFYVDILGCKPIARWENGAYLLAGDLWLALIKSIDVPDDPRPDYTHIAFSCDTKDFPALAKSITESGCREWSENTSEGDSHYFLDPDGHKLEIHVGDLASRLQQMRDAPWAEITFYDSADV